MPVPGPRVAYVLASVPRSGSTLLCHALGATGVLGVPEEYFNAADEPRWAGSWGIAPPKDDYGPYVEAVQRAGSTPNGVLGINLHADHAFRVATLPIPGGVVVHPDGGVAIGPCRLTHFVQMRRRDKVAAALSEWRAESSGQWVLMPGEEPVSPQGSPTVAEITRLHEYHHMWERYWLGTRVAWPRFLELFFEDLVTDVDGAVERVASHVGIEATPAADAVLPVRQPDPDRDEAIDRWVRATAGCAECGHD